MTSAAPAASAAVSRRMRQQRERDTGIEREIRTLLHARGHRFRLHRRLLPGSRRETDIVFVGPRVAVYVDGCFWHGCPEHMSWPKNNGEFWLHKITENQRRDRETSARLTEMGWKVVRVWEHEDSVAAADKIARIVKERAHLS